MARPRQSEPQVDEQTLDGFARQVEAALEHFADATWLGTHSPLAAPYFLGSQLADLPAGGTAEQRGRALQNALQSASAILNPELGEFLRVAFFQRNPNLTSEGLAQALHISRRTLYRNRTSVIQALAHALNQTLLPPLRPEAPLYKTIVGRGQVLSHSLIALRGGRSVYLHGTSGTGKTTLAAVITQEWNRRPATSSGDQRLPPQPGEGWGGVRSEVFWFTLRAGLNDQLTSLVFALGYFLRGHGAAHTWRQLVADKGVVEPERVLGLLRYDLTAIGGRRLLLVIDEVDTLQSEVNEHTQIVHLLEELRALTPLLLSGQRLIIETDEQFGLVGFTEAELSAFLAQVGSDQLAPAIQQRLLERTRGNPALLTLFVALQRSGDEVEAILHALAGGASVEALFNCIWRRLQPDERLLLQRLAVFRTASPQDAWQTSQAALNILQQRELVQVDSQGGVRLLPHIHKLAYDQIPAELKPTLHQQAATIREARSEYVSALYHAIQGKQPVWAVWLWFANRQQEIERGHGAAALALLTAIDATALPDERDRSALRLARAELLKLAGKPDVAESELDQIVAPRRGTLRAYIHELQGDVIQMSERIDHAIQRYRDALEALIDPNPAVEVELHRKLTFPLAFRQGNFPAARKEALWALAKAAASYGNVEEWAGNLTLAQKHYQTAYEMIDGLEGEPEARSRIYSHLGSITLKQGDYEQAITWMQKAMACDHQRGDIVSPLYDQINLVYAYTLLGRFEDAYQQAQDGLTMAERLQQSYLISGLAAGAAEACFYLQRFDDAERYIIQSLNQEEAFFRPWALTVLGGVRSAQNHYAEAGQVLESAIDSAREVEDKYGEAYAWRALGHVHRDHDQPIHAHDAYVTALRLYGELGLDKEVRELQQTLAALSTSPIP